MRTPAMYTKNLKNHVITTKMLLDCLFSVNKRAKNYRDQERKYRHMRYDYYDNEEKNRSKKEEYYRKKDLMLSIIEPVCIHREVFERSWGERIYDYDDEYWQYYEQGGFVHTGGYWDNELKEYVEFGDVIREEKDYRYYLFYDLGGNHTFHTPIHDIPKKYEHLQIIDIDELCTYGHEVEDLVSTQFVKKVIELIESGEYKFVA